MNYNLPELFQKAITEKDFHLKADEEGIIKISEKDQCAKCQYVDISIKTISSVFCFTIDFSDKNGLDFVFPFFNSNSSKIDDLKNNQIPSIKGLRSKNDAILVCQKEEKIYIFLVELKSDGKREYLQQLELSKIFINFILDRLIYLGYEIDKNSIEFRGVLFRCRKRDNQGTSEKKHKADFEKKGSLLIAEELCHQEYRLQYFLP